MKTFALQKKRVETKKNAAASKLRGCGAKCQPENCTPAPLPSLLSLPSKVCISTQRMQHTKSISEEQHKDSKVNKGGTETSYKHQRARESLVCHLLCLTVPTLKAFVLRGTLVGGDKWKHLEDNLTLCQKLLIGCSAAPSPSCLFAQGPSRGAPGFIVGFSAAQGCCKLCKMSAVPLPFHSIGRCVLKLRADAFFPSFKMIRGSLGSRVVLR